MQPGLRQGIVTIIVVIVLSAVVYASGCIQPTNVSQGGVSSQSPAPSNQVRDTVSVGELPSAATGQVSGSVQDSIENKTAVNSTDGPEYAAGSTIQKNMADSSYDRDRMWVIVTVNNDTYTIGQIYYDPKAGVWFKVNEERLVNRVFHAVERDYPVLKGTIDWTSFPVKHGVVDQYGTTRLEW